MSENYNEIINNLIKKLNTNNDKLNIILSQFPDYISAENFQSEHIDILKNIYDSNNIYYKNKDSNSFLSYNSYSKLSNNNKKSYTIYLKKKDTINITSNKIKKIKENKKNKNEKSKILEEQEKIKENELQKFMLNTQYKIIGVKEYKLGGNNKKLYSEFFKEQPFTVQIDRNKAIQFTNKINVNKYLELTH